MCRYCANGDSLLRSDRPLTITFSNEKFVQRAKFSAFVPSSLTCYNIGRQCYVIFVHLYVLLCIFSQLSKDIKMYFGVKWDEGWVLGRPSLEVHQSASSSCSLSLGPPLHLCRVHAGPRPRLLQRLASIQLMLQHWTKHRQCWENVNNRSKIADILPIKLIHHYTTYLPSLERHKG